KNPGDRRKACDVRQRAHCGASSHPGQSAQYRNHHGLVAEGEVAGGSGRIHSAATECDPASQSESQHGEPLREYSATQPGRKTDCSVARTHRGVGGTEEDYRQISNTDASAFGATGPDVNQRGLSLKRRVRTLGFDERSEKQRGAERKVGPAVAS